MAKVPQLLIATSNPGKVREVVGLLPPAISEVASLTDFPNIREVPETGLTFSQNANLKAAGYAVQAGCLSLADDSGLEVAALNGAPGVFSARYGGGHLDFAAKMKLILDELRKTGSPDRSARFVCAIAVADAEGNVLASVEGECRGAIANEPSGSGGFGYDPIFIPEGFDLTFGELPDEVKQRISHRARAAEKIMRYLLDFTGVST